MPLPMNDKIYIQEGNKFNKNHTYLMLKDPDAMTQEEKAVAGIEAIKSFFDSVEGPNDVYKQILLEELIKILLGEN